MQCESCGKLKLSRAIGREDYEEADRLRDEIRRLEQEGSGDQEQRDV